MHKTNSLSGFINIEKPVGLTSADVVRHVKKTMKSSVKVGHAGTLDPFATGVLLILIGSTTRLAQYVHLLPKTYHVEAVLGSTSDTDDVTGKIIDHHPTAVPTREKIEKVAKKFIGEIKQTPPIYSAVKYQGKKLYQLARAGSVTEAEHKAGERGRLVTITKLMIEKYNYPHLHLTVECGTGTYIRSLVRDIGQRVDTGAYTSRLRRAAIGSFTVEQSVKLAQIINLTSIVNNLRSPLALLSHLPHVTLEDANVAKFRNGGAIQHSPPKNLGSFAAVTDTLEYLIGVATWQPEKSLLLPHTVLPPA